jgi:hypothetical protein
MMWLGAGCLLLGVLIGTLGKAAIDKLKSQ